MKDLCLIDLDEGGEKEMQADSNNWSSIKIMVLEIICKCL